MKHEKAEGLYKIFDKFIDTCLVSSDSLLTANKEIITLDNIEECKRRFVDDFKADKRNYEEKIKEQFDKASTEVKIVFAHANWLWAVAPDDITSNGKKKAVEKCLDDSKVLNSDNTLYPIGFGHSGTFHKQNKYWEIVCNLKLFYWIKKQNSNTKENIKQFIEKFCLYAKYNEGNSLAEEIKKDIDKIENTCAMYNILLHLCYPEKYERIASNNHKNNIVSSFFSLLDDSKKEKNIDEQIAAIRQKIELSDKKFKNFDFYSTTSVRDVWNADQSDDEYDEIQGISFKKNIILYGSPGTGKTYKAEALAKSFIIQKMIGENKNLVNEYFTGKIDISNRIKRLQLHSNYSYEDFIIGIKLKDGKTVAEKGYFLDLCETIAQDADKSPYILILDEINRIDLSRLFGEAFSAIENRNKPVELSIKGFSITIPENLYIIGTMNEIDFSLERLDFALRRRFVWFNYCFKTDMLKQIIDKKINDEKQRPVKIDERELELFIEKAEKINEEIDKLNELGRQYEIGHTYFAEIIDIARQYAGRPGYVNKVSIFKTGGPVEVLWKISIKPMIQAFLGNLDEETKEGKVGILQEIFINGKK